MNQTSTPWLGLQICIRSERHALRADHIVPLEPQGAGIFGKDSRTHKLLESMIALIR